jgi:hypothetical protein
MLKYFLFCPAFILLGCSLKPSAHRSQAKFDERFLDIAHQSSKRPSFIDRHELKRTQLDDNLYPMVIEKKKDDGVNGLFDDSGAAIGFYFKRDLLLLADASRTFRFVNTGQSRQDAHLEIIDDLSDHLNHKRITRFYFFPRKYQFAYRELYGVYEIMLPNEEKVNLAKNPHKLVANGPVLIEQKIDANYRYGFPAIEYIGSGLVVKIHYMASQPISSAVAEISYPAKNVSCKLAAQKLFTNRHIKYFKYLDDELFFATVISHCSEFKLIDLNQMSSY